MPKEKERKKANIELHNIKSEHYEKVHSEIFNPSEPQVLDERSASPIKDVDRKRTCIDVG